MLYTTAGVSRGRVGMAGVGRGQALSRPAGRGSKPPGLQSSGRPCPRTAAQSRRSFLAPASATCLVHDLAALSDPR